MDQLHGEFEASLGCKRPIEKKGKERKGKRETEASNCESGFDRGSRKASLRS